MLDLDEYLNVYQARQDKKLKNQGTTKVVEISKEVQERRLKWYGDAKIGPLHRKKGNEN